VLTATDQKPQNHKKILLNITLTLRRFYGG